MFVICPKCGAKYQIPPEISLNFGQKMQCSGCGHYFVLDSKNSFLKNESLVERENLSVDTQNYAVSSQPEEKIITKEKVLPQVFQPSPRLVKKKSSLLLPFLLVIVSLFILLILLGLAWQYREELKFQNNLESVYLNRTPSMREVIKKEESKNSLSELPKTSEVIKVSENADALTVKEDFPQPEKAAPFSFRSLRFHLTQGEAGEIVQIEGIIKNEQNYPVLMPDVVYVNAYDDQGQVLFQKEVFLTQKGLMPQQEQAFFGSYSPAPKEIKWIDVSLQK